MAEYRAYFISLIVITESVNRCHYFALGNRQLELFRFAFSKLFDKHLPILSARSFSLFTPPFPPSSLFCKHILISIKFFFLEKI